MSYNASFEGSEKEKLSGILSELKNLLFMKFYFQDKKSNKFTFDGNTIKYT